MPVKKQHRRSTKTYGVFLIEFEKSLANAVAFY